MKLKLPTPRRILLILSAIGFALRPLLAEDESVLQLQDKIAQLEQENANLRAQLGQSNPAPNSKPVAPTKPTPVAATATPKPPPIWSGNLSAGGSFDRGNTEDNNFTITGELDRNTKQDKLTNGLSGSYGSSRGATTAQRILQATQYNDNLDPRWYALVHEAGTYDRLAGVQYRGVAGPGVGYYVVKNDKFFFNLELGAMAEMEKLRQESTSLTPRALIAENFEYKITPTTRLYGNAEILPDVLDASNYQADGHLNLETQIYRPFSLKFSLNDLYNSRPPVDYQRNDLNAVTALVWKF